MAHVAVDLYRTLNSDRGGALDSAAITAQQLPGAGGGGFCFLVRWIRESHRRRCWLDRGRVSLLREWESNGEPTIVVGVDATEELMALVSRAVELGLPHSVVSDAGRTQVRCGGVMRHPS